MKIDINVLLLGIWIICGIVSIFAIINQVPYPLSVFIFPLIVVFFHAIFG